MLKFINKKPKKIDREFIRQCYLDKGPVEYYAKAVYEIGLWNSEKIIINKYCPDKNSRILDIGCGAGRTTIGLHKIGYNNIMGMDISRSMVQKAQQISRDMGLYINFLEGDIVNTSFNDDYFDLAIFSFNGLMQIPGIENRIKAMVEVKRILKPTRFFIFSAHDRDKELKWDPFWDKEKLKWEKGEYDPKLYDFGDRLINGKANNENTYLHFPDRQEIIYCLNKAGLQLVEDIWRADLCEEPGPVRKFSHSCRFWIARKL